jgi:hypothetical protein
MCKRKRGSSVADPSAEPVPKRAKVEKGTSNAAAAVDETIKAPFPEWERVTTGDPVSETEGKTLDDQKQQRGDDGGGRMSANEKHADDHHDGCGVQGCSLSHEDMPHPQAEASHPDCEDKISVDKGLKTLLEAIWKTGIRTDYSCEHYDWGCGGSGKHYVWLHFPTASDAERFMNRVVSANVTDKERKDNRLADTLYNRILQRTETTPWSFECFAKDTNAEVDGTTFGPPVISFSVGIRFPHRGFEAVCFAFGIE